MQNHKKSSEIEKGEYKISKNNQMTIWKALIPILFVVIMLLYNVSFVYGDNALNGSNQFILLMGAAVASIIGFFNKTTYKKMLEHVSENIKSTIGALLILLFVGALSGTWLISGIIPTMIYYGLQILNPRMFLPACLIICSIVSILTGSSWTTSATVGIALIGIGNVLSINPGMTAGAILSGAYFGDKMSPLSDTTNLAPAMAGGELFSHIKYMAYTTIPTYIITFIIFIVLSLSLNINGITDTTAMVSAIDKAFYITPWVFLVPLIIIFIIFKKANPLVALIIGTLLGGVFAVIFQPDIVSKITGATELTFLSAYKGIMNAMTVNVSINTSDQLLNKLFTSGGMSGMLNTIWLIICAMTFGGVMDAIGALSKISTAILGLFDSIFGLFLSTVISCIGVNALAADQYLSIVIPGKMYAKAFKDKGLAPENLSRTLEDSGTVTSVLIPWNTGGAYHSSVLGVPTLSYIGYTFFNLLSPISTLIFAAFKIKIKQLKSVANKTV